ncbi:MAG TPA: STAS/SEC14 domain-containing protein, partial [Rhizomicrobium sp.]
YELEAMWDDGAFGIRHWREFKRVAVVTDQPWMRAGVSMFAPLIPAEVRLFALAELPAAKNWIADAQHVAE